jgi:methyl-accepting chemotaxis protein
MNFNLKTIYAVLNSAIVALLVVVAAIYFMYQSAEGEMQAAFDNRYKSYLLADELRQSSDDLTRLGRTYVVTGDPAYEVQYFAILDIRNGKKPRPAAYHRIYWDFVAAGIAKPRPDTNTIALEELMKLAGFTDEEFGALKEAQANSDGLVGLEVKAMNAVKGIFADSSGKYTVKKDPDFDLARKLVHSPEYHKFKADIVKPLDKFYELMEERTFSAVTNAQNTTAMLSMILLSAIGIAVLLSIVSGIILYKRLMVPLADMTDAMDHLAGGDLEIGVPGVGRADEIGSMGNAVQVFKENALEKIRLQEEEEAARKERRSREASEREREREQSENETREAQKQHMLGLTNSFGSKVEEILGAVSSQSEEMEDTAKSMTEYAGQSVTESESVGKAAEQASSSVQTVASAAEQLSSSISEISQQVTHSAEISGKAVDAADQTNQTIQNLAEAAQRIGEVVNLINDIAEQTNLLALNATIEAARAGDAGKGFAVVASEVKNLASQTAKATEDIGGQISSIQQTTQEAVSAIGGISSTIGQMNEIATAIAAAVEEQGAATNEISRNVQSASTGTQEVSSSIVNVRSGSEKTGDASSRVLESSRELNGRFQNLRSEVETFLKEIQAS